MTFREYHVTKPENEQALGDELRREALASGVLQLIVREKLSELDQYRNGTPDTTEEVKMRIFEINLENSETGDLPFILGYTARKAIDQDTPITGTGRLQVNGHAHQPQTERTLSLHISEDS